MKSITLAAAVLGAAALLTGCGGDDDSDGGTSSDGGADTSAFTDQSAEEIADAAKEAMSGLESVRMSGAITTGGQEVELDLALSKAGECAGTISLGGASAELIGTDGTAWFKPSDEFWSAQAGAQAETIISLVAGRWVVVPGDDDSFSQFCNLDSMLEQMVSGDGADSYEKGDVSDVDGTEAIAITSNDEENGSSMGYVQVEGDHYLVKIERTEGEDLGAMTFSDFNEEIDAEAPPAEDVVDLNELGG